MNPRLVVQTKSPPVLNYQKLHSRALMVRRVAPHAVLVHSRAVDWTVGKLQHATLRETEPQFQYPLSVASTYYRNQTDRQGNFE